MAVRGKKIGSKTSTTSLLPELLHLEDVVGDFMHYWGFKKIHGRIWTHLFTSEVPLDTAELMRRLKVSKGLMSLALRELLDYKVILPVSTGRHGAVFYEANRDLQSVITNVLRTRETIMLGKTQQFAKRLSDVKSSELEKAQISKAHVQEILNLTESAQGLLEAFLALNPTNDSAIFQNLVTEDCKKQS